VKYDYDLIVIGSGAGGNVGARYAHELGKRVGIVEKGIMGGECPNYACIPANALMRVVDVYNTIKQAESFGIKVAKPSLRLDAVRKWKNLVVRRTGSQRAKATFEKEGIDIIKGTAKFVSPHEIEVAGKTYSSANFLLATGASVIVPEIPGLHESGFMMYDQVIDLDRIPKSIFIIGGGVVLIPIPDF
jgi:mercuric reductase